MFQRQEQDKTSGEELNEVELGNVPDRVMVMIIKILNKLRRRTEEHSEV